MDSGASNSNVNHPDGFTTKFYTGSSVKVADHNTHPVKWEGGFEMMLFKDVNTPIAHALDRALHAPNVRTLFSVHAFMDQGCEIVFKKNQPCLKLPNGHHIPLVEHNGLFHLVYLVWDDNYEYVEYRENDGENVAFANENNDIPENELETTVVSIFTSPINI